MCAQFARFMLKKSTPSIHNLDSTQVTNISPKKHLINLLMIFLRIFQNLDTSMSQFSSGERMIQNSSFMR